MKRLEGETLKAYFRDPTKVPTWWRPEEGRFQFWHEQEFRALDRFVPLAGNERVLDAACGQGRFARYFARHACAVFAMDINRRMLEIARDRASRDGLARNIQFVEGDVENFSILPSASFDVVLCMDAMDHVADLDAAVSNLTRMLRPGGTFITTYTSTHSIYGALRRLYSVVTSRRNDDAVDIAQTYTFERFKQALDRAGIDIVHRIGIGMLMAPQERLQFPLVSRLLEASSRVDIAVKGFHADNWLSTRTACVVVIGTRS